MNIVKPIAISMVALFATAASAVNVGGKVQSMRQSNEILGASVQPRPEAFPDVEPGKSKTMPRAYAGAPAQIPHTIEGMSITSKVRKHECLKCHDRANAKEEEAPSAPPSHYRDPITGKKLDSIHGRRLNCTQCHVPQSDADLRVENTYDNPPFKGTLDENTKVLGW